MVKELHIVIDIANQRAIESCGKLIEQLVQAGFPEAEKGKLYVDEDNKEQCEKITRIFGQFPDFQNLNEQLIR